MNPITKPIYAMSSVGKCPKALSCDRLIMPGATEPAWLQDAAEEGKWHEERIRKQLQEQGYKIIHYGTCSKCLERGIKRKGNHVEINLGNCLLVGHTDGRIYQTPERAITGEVLEIKTFSQYEFDRWRRDNFEAFPSYKGQINCYMFAENLETARYVVKNRNSGFIPEHQIVALDNSYLVKLFETICEVEELAQQGELYPAAYDVTSIECRRCKYKEYCLPMPLKLEQDDTKTIEAAILMYKAGKQKEAEAKELLANSTEIFEHYAKQALDERFSYNNITAQIVHVKAAHVEYDRKAYQFCKVQVKDDPTER